MTDDYKAAWLGIVTGLLLGLVWWQMVTLRAPPPIQAPAAVCSAPGHKLWLVVCSVTGADFRSPPATFRAVSNRNKTLDKPAETCQG
jgi:hypothetical protein